MTRLLFEVDGMGDSPDPSAWVILAAILVGGFALLAAAAWYSAKRGPRD